MQTATAAPSTTLNATFTVDDAYSFYLSTDDSVLGKKIGADDDWYKAESYSAALVPGVTNYIHISGTDLYGVIAAFMGEFTLSDNKFHFANGTQTLLTNADEWKISTTGFGQKYEKPTQIAYNGEAIWGDITTFDKISPKAAWIWTNNGDDLYTTRYFSAAILPAAGAVPEPLTLSFLLLGGLVWVRGRK
jgi:hypothetical protein